jgi:hypothetical protein
MSSRLRTAATAALVVGALSAARGQSLQELTRNLDAAVAMRDDAAKAVAAYQLAQAKTRIHNDTVTLAGQTVRIPTDSEIQPLIQRAAAGADSFLRRQLGDRLSIVPAATFIVRVDTMSPKRQWLIVSRFAAGREGNRQLILREAPAMTRALESLVDQLLIERRPRISEWLNAPLPIDTTSDDAWRVIRLQLAASPTTIARRCYNGSVAACKAFLGLTVEADPATAWYDSTTRRDIVRSRRSALDGAASTRCIEGNDADCVGLMRTSAALAPMLGAPALSNARVALVAQALGDGGSGSLASFLDRDSLTVALAAASKLPLDSVVAHWQRHVHDAGIRSDAFTPGIAVLSLGWIVMLGGLATRSSRWR